MVPPVELVVRILAELWAGQYSIDEQVIIFSACSLVSKQWSAVIKQVNSTHSFIPFSYNGGRLYSIKSLSSISHPMLCRTITFRIDYVTLPGLLRAANECTPSVEANREIVSTLRKMFHGPNPPVHVTHIYVDYVDDSQIHIPRFWVPRQITRLTIIYHYRRCVSTSFRLQYPRSCHCGKPTIKPRVQHLTVMGATPVIVKQIAVCSSISVIKEWYDFPRQDIGLDFVYRCMFGERRNSDWLRWYYGSRSGISTAHNIPMLEQVIPVGSVGYIDPLSRKFIILFNAIDPTSSTEPRIHEIASLLEGETTKLIIDPNYSPVLEWDCKRTLFNTDALGAFMEQRSIYDILVGLGCSSATLYLALGRAFARHLIGTHFDSWFLEHKQKILDVFEDDHPYIRKGLELVTTAIDSAQYAWLAHLAAEGRAQYVNTTQFLCCSVTKTHPQIRFRLDPMAVNTHGSVWGEFLPPPRRYNSESPDIMAAWVHVSTVGQSPKTVEINCHSLSLA
ncbi:uncharacterized protein EV420DRAFT_1639121 [Desarmillaria tabescens]|uniref:Uncharacterized protein n=1 Tax=Armillaria tabescens TaxID=1929756 RepID=A0AA39NCB8_ARMTA|nr:uncharacterized protein EV420DRAFT_1639121 [Desarmillaria tabescens]KAK0463036.1 hypothetical protein EV420DRAFT_1639121 [Desarmillaria tabescens]